LLSLGFAGAVDPALESGDLVLSSRYYRATEDKNPPNLTLLNESERRFNSLPPSNKVPTEEEDQQDYFTADPTMWRHAVKAAEGLARPAVPVESLTVNDLMTTPQAKEALRRSYEVGVIDMEDYWVASAAHDAGVPFLSARVVLDRVDQSLPSYLLRFTESRATAILQTVAKPWRIPVLINLARRLPAAQHTLARFALFFSAQLASNQPAHSHQGAAGPGALNGASRSIGE
jgi:adenosylhomocysteine nucleosidase